MRPLHHVTELLAKTLHRHEMMGVLVINQDLVITYANNTICRIGNVEHQDLIGSSMPDVLYHGMIFNKQGKYLSPLVEAMCTGREIKGRQVLLPEPFFVTVWSEATIYLQRDASGTSKYAIGYYTGIEQLKTAEKKLENINMQLIRAFTQAIESRDAYTGLHSQKVADLMAAFARSLGWNAADSKLAYLAAVVHDIGKIGISEAILNKTGQLTREEYACMKQHPVIGANILAEIKDLAHLANIVRHHHERFDGRGYPDGLTGDQIPPISRMLFLCDSYEAMTGLRCYRRPISPAQAAAEIRRCCGTQFDPVVGQQFLRFLKNDYLQNNIVVS